jgi:branched-chain amino acid aminotransferase
MTYCWFKGNLQTEPLQLSPADRGLTLGDGVFETLLVIGGVAMWRQAHLNRMERAATELGIDFPSIEIDEAITQLCEKCMTEAWVLRLTLTRGVTSRNLWEDGTAPTFLATIARTDPRFMFTSVEVITSKVMRNETAPSSRMKTLSYIDQVFAARQAHAAKASDALLFNSKDVLAASTIANVFVLSGHELATPAVNEGALPGVVRRFLIDSAPQIGFTLREGGITRAELQAADGVFLTNSLRLLRPVTALDGIAVPHGRVETIIDLLASETKRQCGVDPRSI